ncbi:unnamed protein product, partial [Sphacelaria rigidula]
VVLTQQSQQPVTRGGAIAAAAAGLLTSLAGASIAGAETPASLPSCPTEGNCVSSSSFKLVMQEKYLAPWYFADDKADPKDAFSKLEDAVQKDANLKTVETDAEKFYLRAVARSAVPPDGFDKVEFLLRPEDGLVTFRSSSQKNVYAGPVIVGDGGSNRNRLEALRRRLGWPEKGIDNYMKEQGIDSGTSRAKGFLSELGWRQAETQYYGEDED